MQGITSNDATRPMSRDEMQMERSNSLEGPQILPLERSSLDAAQINAIDRSSFLDGAQSSALNTAISGKRQSKDANMIQSAMPTFPTSGAPSGLNEDLEKNPL